MTVFLILHTNLGSLIPNNYCFIVLISHFLDSLVLPSQELILMHVFVCSLVLHINPNLWRDPLQHSITHFHLCTVLPLMDELKQGRESLNMFSNLFVLSFSFSVMIIFYLLSSEAKLLWIFQKIATWKKQKKKAYKSCLFCVVRPLLFITFSTLLSSS